MQCKKKHNYLFERFCKLLFLWGFSLLLSACATTQVGVPSGAQSKYEKITVVPRISGRLLTVHRQSELSQPIMSEADMGWNAAGDAGQISKELLGRTGASVSVTSDPRGASAKAAQAVIILQQTPLDQFAQNYSPERDVIVSIAVAAVMAEATGIFYLDFSEDDVTRYRRRSILEITGAQGDGPNYCAVGITPFLVDASTGETIRKGRSLMGTEKVPVRISGVTWQQLTTKERSTVLAYCQSALRRAVSQSFVELDIVN